MEGKLKEYDTEIMRKMDLETLHFRMVLTSISGLEEDKRRFYVEPNEQNLDRIRKQILVLEHALDQVRGESHTVEHLIVAVEHFVRLHGQFVTHVETAWMGERMPKK
jgi:hypothetical protein